MKTRLIVTILLLVFFVLALTSSWGDSNTFDEAAHTPAGYSYVVKRDMRLNPEHPPLLKDLAGFSIWLGAKISGTPIRFDDQHPAWKENVNSQWAWGNDWLFHQGNDADRIVFWARFPFVLLGTLFGWCLFYFGREFFGVRVGLLALFLYAFSPTFLAHTRLVTTDVGAAFGFFIAIAYFLRWFKEKISQTLPYPLFSPERRANAVNVMKAGLALGLAQLLKFSPIILVPYFILVLAVLWAAQAGTLLALTRSKIKHFVKHFGASLGGLGLMMLISSGMIWLVYSLHVQNYPRERQRRDTAAILARFAGGPPKELHSGAGFEAVCNPFAVGLARSLRCPAEIAISLADKPLLRPFAQYLFGVLTVFQRTAGGNTTYFWGQLSTAGWWYYFPTVYLLKETLALHLLTFIAIVLALRHVLQRRGQAIEEIIATPASHRQRFFGWIRNHPAEVMFLSFIGFYWAQSILFPLNIGVRHVLPTFPFIYLLVSRQIAAWLRIRRYDLRSASIVEVILTQPLRALGAYLVVIGALTAMVVASLNAFPSYLSYYNELVGTDNGYAIAVDSNYDWGQDLKRLARFVEEKNIEKIKVHYFGGSDLAYYLKDRYEWLDQLAGPQQGWLAVSATLLQGGRARPAAGFDQPTDYFEWLNAYRPVARAGKSIFIYYIQ